MGNGANSMIHYQLKIWIFIYLVIKNVILMSYKTIFGLHLHHVLMILMHGQFHEPRKGASSSLSRKSTNFLNNRNDI